MPRFKDLAICLRSREWSESSQIVVLLTRSRGKVRGLAKGAKRMSPGSVARFSGGVELLQRGEVVATTRSTAELANVTEWDLHDDHPAIRANLPALRRALYAVDISDQLIGDEDPHPAVFHALADLLARPDDENLLRYQWALLIEAGYRPQLVRDVHDDSELPTDPAASDAGASSSSGAGKLWFDPRGGGLTRRDGISDWRVSPATVAVLRSLDDVGQFEDEERPAVHRANRLLCAYIRYLLDRETATMRFLL